MQYLTFPVWWRWLDAEQGGPGFISFPVRTELGALVVGLTGIGWAALALGLPPVLARLQAAPGRGLLAADPDTDLSLRVAQLTATRAAALDAHAVELRRIERSLHDGTQNRLVAVNVLLGAARRALTRDPDTAGEILERAQDAAEQALAELRTVVRGILPRCWPTAVSPARSPAWSAAAPFPAPWTWRCRDAARSRWRRPRTLS
nr:hypothetical protein GCM10020092_053610 [Actinoplanes digitatis]